MQPGKTLDVTLIPNATSDYNLQFVNATNAVLTGSTLGTGATDTAAWTNTGATPFTVYVKVYYGRGGKGPVDGRYSLSFSQ